MTYLHFPGNTTSTTATPCTSCPSVGASCAGGVLQLSNDAWYDIDENPTVDKDTEMHTCFNDECCINTATVPVCDASKGYFGPLCGACDRDNEQRNGTFTRSGRGCVRCWRPWASWLATVALGGAALVALTYLVMRHKFDVPKGDYSAYCTFPLPCTALRPLDGCLPETHLP